MIVVLKGANFASDNIGQVEIPRELDAFTVEFLTHYSKTLTDEQKYAVDDFLTSMRSSGLWDKMGMIFFPMLASTLQEAYYNPTGKSSAPSSYKGYGLSNGGLVIDLTNGYTAGDTFDGGHPVLTANDIDVSTQGYHYASLSGGNGRFLVGSFKGGAYPVLESNRATIFYQKADVSFTDTDIVKGLSLHMSVLEAPNGNISADRTFMMAAGVFADQENAFVENSAVAATLSVYDQLQPLSLGNLEKTDANSTNQTDTIYLWSVGKALTKQEALLYHQYCEDLKTSFGLS